MIGTGQLWFSPSYFFLVSQYQKIWLKSSKFPMNKRMCPIVFRKCIMDYIVLQIAYFLIDPKERLENYIMHVHFTPTKSTYCILHQLTWDSRVEWYDRVYDLHSTALFGRRENGRISFILRMETHTTTTSKQTNKQKSFHLEFEWCCMSLV